MQKNQIIGFMLLFVLFLGYTYLNQPTKEELEQRRLEHLEQVRQDSLAQIKALNPSPVADPSPVIDNRPDSLKVAENSSAYGMFASASVGENKIVTLENDDIKLDFSSKGGKIVKATLKKFNRTTVEEGEEVEGIVEIMNNPNNKFGFNIPANVPAGAVSTENLFFTPTLNGNNLKLTAQLANGASISQEYNLAEKGYQVDYRVKTNGLDNLLPAGQAVQLNWVNYLTKQERNATFEASYSTAYFKNTDTSNPDYCSCRASDEEETSEPVEWVANTNQFFNTSLMTNGKPFKSAKLETITVDDVKKSDYLKKIVNNIEINPSDLASGFDVKMYIGPNEFKDLRAYGVHLEQIIPYGNSIFGSINRWIIRPFFDFLSSFISSRGLTIILLIFIIKMLLYPLMYKMLKSQALMGALKEKTAPLKEKYGDDPQKLQMEQMKLYREYGVSPLGGCLPMFLQMPIWYALFRFFPSSITFRQQPFLWVQDLSSYDDFFNLGVDLPFLGTHLSLFAILWAITTVIYTYYNTKNMDMSAGGQNANMMKYMQYLMPIMFFGFFNNYAAGLVCYMFFSNLINILQTVITKKVIFTDDKLKAELAKKKSKPKKTNGFQARLEEAMKQQQELQKQKNKNK